MEKIEKLFSYKFLNILVVLFVGFALWRLALDLITFENHDLKIQVWAASYQFIAWVGAIAGLYLSRYWGGYKSIMGRAAIAFSLGLLMQSFGQSVFSYYFYHGIELPYPSLADVGFFGSIPFYIYGMVLLAKSSGAHVKSLGNKLLALGLPLALLVYSYSEFLKGYDFSAVPNLQIFLDFGYPLGQAIYISIAILAYILSRNTLGGMMRSVILFFIGALVMQYVSDYTFLHQSMNGTFIGGGSVDCLYFASYFLMALSLTKLGMVFEKLRSTT